MQAITNENNTNFEKFLIESIKKSKRIWIASGYVGIDGFKKIEPLLKNVVESGGEVILIFGLGSWQGISSKLELILREFHKYISQINPTSGVFFCQKDRYHGKIYLFQSTSNKWVTVGSSNLSPSGFGGWHEANVEIQDRNTYAKFEEYFNRLLKNNAKPIAILKFPSKDKEQLLKEAYEQISIPPDLRSLPLDFKLEIKTLPLSHVNLFAGSGRGNKKTGIYKKRPWYEVELGIGVEEVKSNLTPFLPKQKEQYKLKLVDDDGNVLNANFKRKTGGKKSEKTLHEIGLDFMTGTGEKNDRGKKGRIQLGIFIKDKLIDAGLLRYGELITQDILDMYGNHFLEFRKLPDKKDYYYITFDPVKV